VACVPSHQPLQKREDVLRITGLVAGFVRPPGLPSPRRPTTAPRRPGWDQQLSQSEAVEPALLRPPWHGDRIAAHPECSGPAPHPPRGSSLFSRVAAYGFCPRWRFRPRAAERAVLVTQGSRAKPGSNAGAGPRTPAKTMAAVPVGVWLRPRPERRRGPRSAFCAGGYLIGHEGRRSPTRPEIDRLGQKKKKTFYV